MTNDMSIPEEWLPERILPYMKTGMVLVFKTSLQTEHDCRQLALFLDNQVGINQWTVDLEDCDRVLRIVATDMSADCIIQLVQSQGFWCAELTD